MNIYLHELKALRKSAILWTCSITALALLFLSVYPTVANDAEDFKKILENYPVTVREMLGINLDYIASLVGFYSMVFSFIILCAAIQAMNLGVSILSKEAREKTADFLLVKPVSRLLIVRAKLFAALTTIVFTDIFFFISSMIIAELVNNSGYDRALFFLINLTILFIQLIFLAIGLAVSVFFHKIRNILPISLGTVFGFYMIGALIVTEKNDASLRFISPFQYFNITYIIKHSKYEIPYLLLGAGIVLIGILISFIIYQKKDIHAVS